MFWSKLLLIAILLIQFFEGEEAVWSMCTTSAFYEFCCGRQPGRMVMLWHKLCFRAFIY